MTPTMIELPELKELTFDDPTHTYRVNGVVIPSVSTIMEPLTAAKYKGISESTLNNAANKGTSVHNAIENYIKFGIEDVPSEHRPYFNGFLEWYNIAKPQIIASEFRCYHKLMMYGGTLDILSIEDGLLTVTDIKTTYTVYDMTCKVQLEGYSQILASLGLKVQKKQILHLAGERGWKICGNYPAQDAEAWRVFGSLKCVHDYIGRTK